MYKTILSWKKSIKNEKLKHVLFNKYYNVLHLYWNIFYSFWLSVASGVGNTFSHGFTTNLFLEGFLNSIPLSLFINLFYTRLIQFLTHTNHPRLYANIANVAVNALFFTWHTYLGTSNPLQAVAIPLGIGILLTNYHVTKALSNKHK